MTSLFSIQYWGSISPKDIPEDTHTLTLEKIPATSSDELHRLFGSVPQLTRLTCQQWTKEKGDLDWREIGKALLKTPHVNYLDCSKCYLNDKDLLKILEGCTLELCELRLGRNVLELNDQALFRRLQYFTNLQ